MHRPTTQPYTVALTTGYSVPAGYRLHSPVHLLPQLVSECTGRYRLHSLVNLLQLLVTECTGWYLLHSLVHLLQLLVTECTSWYWLHSLLHLLQPTGYKSTNRVLATQSLLYRVQGFTPTGYKKKKKLAKYRPVAV